MRLQLLAAEVSRAFVSAAAEEADVEIGGSFAPVDELESALHARTACDLVILPHARLLELTATGEVNPATVADLGTATNTLYTAAVHRLSHCSRDARDFLRRLTGEALAPARENAGFAAPIVRPAERRHEAAIRELVFSVLVEYGKTPDPSGTDLDLFDLDTHYFLRGGMFDVALDTAGRVVACCGTYVKEDGACELRKMYVRRDQRGARLGTRLLERALAYARSRGSERMELETASELREAIAMYEKAGFVRQAHAPHVSRCDRAYALEL